MKGKRGKERKKEEGEREKKGKTKRKGKKEREKKTLSVFKFIDLHIATKSSLVDPSILKSISQSDNNHAQLVSPRTSFAGPQAGLSLHSG